MEHQIFNRLFNPSLICKKCNTFIVEPMTCAQCFEIYCSSCISNFCLNCKSSNIKENKALRNIISQIEYICESCNRAFPSKDIKNHVLQCQAIKCSICSYKGTEFWAHLITEHKEAIIQNYSQEKLYTNVDLDTTVVNQDDDLRPSALISNKNLNQLPPQLGILKSNNNTQLYYCNNDNGFDGNQCAKGNLMCKKCMTLTKKALKLTNGELINTAGKVCNFRNYYYHCKETYVKKYDGGMKSEFICDEDHASCDNCKPLNLLALKYLTQEEIDKRQNTNDI